MIEICFVCTGNTCRSVMAERIAKKMAKNRGMKGLKFSSAGIYATGEQISPNAAAVLKKLGYDGRARKSVKLKKTKPNSLYVAVTKDHIRFIPAQKVMSFEDLAGSVADPYGRDLACYEQTAHQIEQNIGVLLDRVSILRGEK